MAGISELWLAFLAGTDKLADMKFEGLLVLLAIYVPEHPGGVGRHLDTVRKREVAAHSQRVGFFVLREDPGRLRPAKGKRETTDDHFDEAALEAGRD